MSRGTIPDWNADGCLPPINPINPTATDRSPYVVSLADLVLRFGNLSKDRLEGLALEGLANDKFDLWLKARVSIIEGLLSFRSVLHTVGLMEGFQWVNGSFLEQIEEIEQRSPRDIDVVTFFHLPEGQNQESLLRAAPRIFNRDTTKLDYHVDAYFVPMNDVAPVLVSQSAYWYSMWSHRRNGQWKGYLQIDLSTSEDQIAKANLDQMINQGANDESA